MLTGHSSPLTERELRFTHADLELFALASGDLNPLHLDPQFARETAFGSCIVHGALLAIGMLGTVPEEALARIAALRFWFAGAVFPGPASRVSATPSSTRPGAWEIRLIGRGKVLARALADPDARAFARGLRSPPPHSAPAGSAMRTLPADPDPAALDAGRVLAGEYQAGPELGDLARRWRAQRLDPVLLDGLAWASYVVGMEIPGRHGLFTALTLAAGDATPAERAAARHGVAIRNHDRRSGQLVLDGILYDTAGGIRCVAAIDAFALPPAPAPDARALGVSERAPTTRRGSVAVVGASRGFGASLTLALLAAGFDVHGLYASASASAAGLERLAGPCRERLHMQRLDARDPDALASFVAEAKDPIQGVVLSAAPALVAMGLTGESGAQLADYVAESVRLAAVPLAALLPLVDPTEGWILFCSSAALAAPPRDWPHYVSAKAALEGLARWVAASAPNLRTIVIRPPSMLTSLVNTPSGRLSAVPTEAVAGRIARRIVAGDLPAGLTVLEPPDLEAGAK